MNAFSNNIVFFTMHRSGSCFLSKLAKDLTNKKKYNYVKNFNKCHQNNKKNVIVLRNYSNDVNPKNNSIIMNLRDPRDVLVSMYFSYCFFHKGKIKPNTGKRKKIAKQGINKFALGISKSNNYVTGGYGTGTIFGKTVLERYEEYLNFVNNNNVIFVKYEEMVTDFENWLSKIVKPFKFYKEDKIIKSLSKKYKKEFVLKREEDITRHRRKMTPGDFRTKLTKKTIIKLNKLYKGILLKGNWKM